MSKSKLVVAHSGRVGYNEIMRTQRISIIIVGIILAVMLYVVYAFPPGSLGKQETCPQDNGWTKIDSGDLSLYPVSNAVEYCFKAGNWLESEIPDGGFGQDGSCKNGIQYCELSHWSYKIGEITPTLTPTPTNEPTQSPTPTLIQPTSTITPTPTVIQIVTPTPTPTDKPINDDGCCSTETNNPVNETGQEVVLESAPLSK